MVCAFEWSSPNILRPGTPGADLGVVKNGHATNVKIATLNNSPVIFYHAAAPYNSPVSVIMQRLQLIFQWKCSPVIKFQTVAEPTSLVKSMSS